MEVTLGLIWEQLSRMDERNTQSFDAIGKHIDEKFEEIDVRFDKIDNRMEGMDKQFEKIERRLTGMDEQFDKIETRLTGMEKHLDTIDRRFDGVDLRLNRTDDKMMLFDKRFETLLERAGHLSDSTNHRFGSIEKHLISIDANVGSLNQTIGVITKRLDAQEIVTENIEIKINSVAQSVSAVDTSVIHLGHRTSALEYAQTEFLRHLIEAKNKAVG